MCNIQWSMVLLNLVKILYVGDEDEWAKEYDNSKYLQRNMLFFIFNKANGLFCFVAKLIQQKKLADYMLVVWMGGRAVE